MVRAVRSRGYGGGSQSHGHSQHQSQRRIHAQAHTSTSGFPVRGPGFDSRGWISGLRHHNHDWQAVPAPSWAHLGPWAVISNPDRRLTLTSLSPPDDAGVRDWSRKAPSACCHGKADARVRAPRTPSGANRYPCKTSSGAASTSDRETSVSIGRLTSSDGSISAMLPIGSSGNWRQRMMWSVEFRTASGDNHTKTYRSAAAVRGAMRSGYCRRVRETAQS